MFNRQLSLPHGTRKTTSSSAIADKLCNVYTNVLWFLWIMMHLVLFVVQ